MSDDRTDSTSERVYALIFNGITRASSAATNRHDGWLPLSERERLTQAVFAELRAGNIEFRLGGFALLAEAIDAEGAEEEALSTEHSSAFPNWIACGHKWSNGDTCTRRMPSSGPGFDDDTVERLRTTYEGTAVAPGRRVWHLMSAAASVEEGE
jgi:hypothetical protein